VLKLSDALEGWSPSGGNRPHQDPVLLLGAVWPEIVGENVARNSNPARLLDGTLLIITRSSSWSQELSFLAERIVAAARARLPNSGIERVRFRVGKLPAAPGSPGVRPHPVRRAKGIAPPASSTTQEALGRLREGVTGRQRAKLTAGWNPCSGCGALVAPDGAALCSACVNARTQARTEATARLLFEAPWLGYRGTAALVDGLSPQHYGSIRRRLLARWWGILERARVAKRFSRDGIERAVASSYVVLKSELPPDDIRPATMRNVLGDELHDFLFGTEQLSETNGE
jgi:Dna[CI] antecedent, DciA